MLFPQPEELTVDEPLEPTDDPCTACGEATVFTYRVVDFRGWLRVTKCRSCLHVVSSERRRPPVQEGVA